MIKRLLMRSATSRQRFLYMMSYFAVAVISVAINLFGYGVAIRVIERDIQQNSTSALRNVQNLFDYNFTGSINSAYYVLQSNAVRSLFDNASLSSWQKTSYIRSISLDLQNVMYGQGFIEESLLISKNKGLCITSTGGSSYSSTFDIYFSEYYEDEQQWESDFFGVKTDGLKILTDSDGECHMFLVYNLPELNADKCVIIKINRIAVNANLKALGENEEEYFITDSSGAVVFSTLHDGSELPLFDLSQNNKTIKLAGEKQVLTVTKSDFDELNYIRTVPSGIYLEKIRLVRFVFIFGFAICILIGMLFANIFSELIEKSRKKLLDALTSREQSMRKYVIRQILVGGISEDNIQKVLSQNNIALDNQAIVVLLFDFYQSEERISAKNNSKIDRTMLLTYMERYFGKCVGDNVYFCEINKMCFGIMNLKNSRDAFSKLKENTEALFERTSSEFGVGFVCAMSGVFNDVREINLAYEQATDIINLCFLGDDKSIMSYDDVMEISGCEVDDISEKKLINYLCLSDREALSDFINKLYDDIVSTGKISVGMLKVFTVQIINIIFKSSVQGGGKADYKTVYKTLSHINTLRNADEFKAAATEYALDCCVENPKSNDLASKRYQVIEQYIKDNYADPTLNGNILADTFKMNRSYLSENFKKYIGEGLADYIVKYRLKKAKELLEEGEAINKVAFSVGFSSSVVFNRAFKKFEGITPTQYKKITN